MQQKAFYIERVTLLDELQNEQESELEIDVITLFWGTDVLMIEGPHGLVPMQATVLFCRIIDGRGTIENNSIIKADPTKIIFRQTF